MYVHIPDSIQSVFHSSASCKTTIHTESTLRWICLRSWSSHLIYSPLSLLSVLPFWWKMHIYLCLLIYLFMLSRSPLVWWPWLWIYIFLNWALYCIVELVKTNLLTIDCIVLLRWTWQSYHLCKLVAFHLSLLWIFCLSSSSMFLVLYSCQRK